MTFQRLSEYFQKLESTTLRLKMTEILAELFRKADEKEIVKICYILQGRVAPLYEAVEFGIADKMMIRAIADALQVKSKKVADLFKKTGDLGITVERIKNNEFRPKGGQAEIKGNKEITAILIMA